MRFEGVNAELTRNLSGYFLVLVGLAAIWGGGHAPSGVQTALIDAGKGLVGAALIAFQIKRTPDGNTVTTQITTPPPAMPPIPHGPEEPS